MRRRWKAWCCFVVLVLAVSFAGCLSAEPVEASRDDCLRAIGREFTAYMADHDCRSILGVEYCQALRLGMDVRAERGLASEKIQRVYYRNCG